MAIPTTALEGDDSEDALRGMELESDDLRTAATVGYTHAAACTKHEPRSLPGTLVWGKGTGHLRDRLKGRGWKPDSESNLERVVNSDGTVAIVIVAGTPDTGRAGGTPRTKYPKGPATFRVVAENAQLSLADVANIFGEAGHTLSGEPRETWVLLHYFDADAGEIRLELSLPDEMTRRQITSWHRRMILTPVPFGSEVDIPIEDDGDDDIDIDIQRKAD